MFLGENRRSFSAVCHNNFGREVIKTKQRGISKDNIVSELKKALVIHNQNAEEIEYLDRYYKGDQPVLYRKKDTRPEVNNKIVCNIAYELVERKVAEICAEPIQYVLRGTEEEKLKQITALNKMLDVEGKNKVTIEVLRWRSICGVGYIYVANDNQDGMLLDESTIDISCENPTNAFVVYFSNGKPAFSCQIRENENNEKIYICFTRYEFFVILNDTIVENGKNGYATIPLIEYPNNSRRLSDIEITINITDAINVLQSDRINGVEQFVSSWIKFVNCEIDKEKYREMRKEGALVIKSNNGENKADVDIMTTELNQTQGQVVFNDLFDRFLSIQGLANRQGSTSAGNDSAGAVQLRNGHYDSQLRAAINEPILKESEMMFLRLVLQKLRIEQNFTLMPSDIEVHINHNKFDNILIKAEVLKMLLDSGINWKRAIKTVDMFSDPEQVAIESQKRMALLYPDEITTTNPSNFDMNGNIMYV